MITARAYWVTGKIAVEVAYVGDGVEGERRKTLELLSLLVDSSAEPGSLWGLVAEMGRQCEYWAYDNRVLDAPF